MHAQVHFLLVVGGKFEACDVHASTKHLNDMISVVGFLAHCYDYFSVSIIGHWLALRFHLSWFGLIAGFGNILRLHIFERILVKFVGALGSLRLNFTFIIFVKVHLDLPIFLDSCSRLARLAHELGFLLEWSHGKQISKRDRFLGTELRI